MENCLTIKDVANLMQVSNQTVYRWMRLGRLRPVRVGRTVRFRRRDVLHSLELYEFGGQAPRDFAVETCNDHDPALG